MRARGFFLTSVVSLLLLLCPTAHAQTTIVFLPVVRRDFDSTGMLWATGHLYERGTRE